VTTLDTYPLGRLEGEARRFAHAHQTRLSLLAPLDLELWADMAEHIEGQRLRDKRTFFNITADGLRVVGDHPALRGEVHERARRLTRRSSRLAASFLGLCRDLMPKVTEGDFSEIAERAGSLERDIDVATTFMDYAKTVLAQRDMDYLRLWHEGAHGLSAVDWRASRGFLEATARAARWLHTEDLPVIAALGAEVAPRSSEAAKGLFKALPALMASMSVSQLGQWVEMGLESTSRENDLVLYMSYGSKRSQETVEKLCRATSFAAFRAKISRMLEAFLGRPSSVRSIYDLLDASRVPPDVPAFSDGEHLYVRPTLGCAGLTPFSLYKLVALHASAHERFGSYSETELETMLARSEVRLADDSTRGTTDLDRFLFGLAEDFRVDTAMLRTLPGLRADAETIVWETYEPYAVGIHDSGPGATVEAQTRPGSGVSVAPASLRAHAAAFPLGLRLLADHEAGAKLEGILAPLASPEAGPADSVRVAKELGLAFGDRLLALADADALSGADRSGVDVPHPPYYDHLFLGMKIASMAGSGGSESSTPLLPGTPVDVPGSLHPSEIMEGLEITIRDKQQEADLLILDDDEEDEDDFDGETYTYHEWDSSAGDFRTSWCTVRHRDILKGDPSFIDDTLERYQGEVLLIRRQFERLRPDRIKRYFRQRDGDELDLDALTEAIVDARAGTPMRDNVFIRRDKKQRDVAVLFLLDMSDSTDQLVTESERVIDVEKQGLVLLSEAIDQLKDSYAIMGFTSRGRRFVDVFHIKDFADEFDEGVAGRIAGIEPCDYTRLGAALRHATERLARVDAGVRLLVLLSDGRPYDMGYGDLQYAMADTKMALTEAMRRGVKVFCITVDPEGPDYLEDMFGAHRFTVIQNVEHLPTKLPRIYRNLTV
jgi:nitric oxide reductase NorD protein